MKISKIIFVLIACLSLLAMLSCSSDSDKVYNYQAPLGDFQLKSLADTIYSYSGGGGIFVIGLDPDSVFNNSVAISIAVDPALHAELTDSTISNSHSITELTIAPGATDIDSFQIIVTGTCESLVRKDTLAVIMSTDPGPIPQGFIDARDEIIAWVVEHDSVFASLDGESFTAYLVRLGVSQGSEIWEFLSSSWHLKLIRPSMPNPPYTMYLRYRGEWDCCLTVRKNADGSIEEIQYNR